MKFILQLFIFTFLQNVVSYNVGTGIYDITGPAAEVGMMGYAMLNQRTSGLHYRLRARAYIIGDSINRVAFVSLDSCMVFTGVKQKVMEKLKSLYGELYDYENVLLSGEHTHAGPGGYAMYALYDITTLGFYKENFEVIVDGVVKAIQEAHSRFETNTQISIKFNNGTLLNSNRNRSPSAYLANPLSERQLYPYDVDKDMVLLRFEEASSSTPIAALNWFAVHGTSMSNTNELISGDNKGYAAYLFEKYMNGNSTLPGNGPFISAFAQTNEGDVSPNTRGAFCNNGDPCEVAHSTCNGRSEGCHAYGPGKDEFESTKIIGTNQFKKALELFNSANVELKGPVSFIHTFIDFSNITVSAAFTSTGEEERTCTGALGDSFAAGTTDGPGEFDFKQGTNSSKANPYWNFIGSFLSDPTPEQIKCQTPKPILLNVGAIDFPVPWTPSILPLQILRIGQLFLVGVPGEFTTMAGRRLRNTVREAIKKAGITDNSTLVVIAGLSNAYSHYITTYEEFCFQRYEGASTLYGPHTLAAYQQEFTKLVTALVQNTPYPPGPSPPDLTGQTPSFIPPVIFDDGSFGSVYQDVNSFYLRGQTAEVIFYGANPRNDFRTNSTYLTVEQYINNQWQVVLTDSDWDTKFQWSRHLIAESLITITWDIGLEVVPGKYRIKTFGSSKDIFGTLTPYDGTSSTFEVR